MRITDRTEGGFPVLSLVQPQSLVKVFPLETVRRILAETGRKSQRVRDLPAQLMVYYVIFLAFCQGEKYREALRKLAEGLRNVPTLRPLSKISKDAALCRARQRLGEEVLRRLFGEVARPLATPETKGAFYRRWRTVALDGTTVVVPDSAQNQKAFGRPSSTRGRSAYPRMRLVALVETGTHTAFAAELGPYSTGEVKLAHRLVEHLTPGMLCLADRYFLGFALWAKASLTGADLLWRVRRHIHLPVEERLPDGSYLSRLYPKRQKGQTDRNQGLRVRVIEYRLENEPESEPLYRLVTTILDWEAAPACELAALYHERWEVEGAFDEIKTHLGAPTPVLRSQKPEMVEQEVWGILLAHFAVRSLMHEAAVRGGLDPDRLSFVHAVRVIGRSLPRFAAFPPGTVAAPA